MTSLPSMNHEFNKKKEEIAFMSWNLVQKEEKGRKRNTKTHCLGITLYKYSIIQMLTPLPTHHILE